MAADARRQRALEALGFTVLRFTWQQVHGSPEAVAADLRRRLG